MPAGRADFSGHARNYKTPMDHLLNMAHGVLR